MLNVGDEAPDISVPDSDMEMQDLKSFLDGYLVLYFYPKDDTPGCTIQANDFTDMLDDFEAAGARVVGVSQDDCFSHQAFRDKYGLKVQLLADVDGEVCGAYDVIQEKEKNGVRKMGLVRSTFIIGPDGIIKYVEYGVLPKGHAQKILDIIRAGL